MGRVPHRPVNAASTVAVAGMVAAWAVLSGAMVVLYLHEDVRVQTRAAVWAVSAAVAAIFSMGLFLLTAPS
jgi:hypothetical protein